MPQSPALAATTVSDRDTRLAQTFVELADTFVVDFDLPTFLNILTQRCVELLEVAATGVLLCARRGDVCLTSSSSQRAQLLQQCGIHLDEGPSLDAVGDRQPVVSPNLAAEAHRWPRFVAVAHQYGFRGCAALPMRRRGAVIGVVTLLDAEPDRMGADTVDPAQALADVATIGILHQRAIHHSEVVNQQLQTALNSRVIIAQATGVLAERADLTMDAAVDRQTHGRDAAARAL